MDPLPAAGKHRSRSPATSRPRATCRAPAGRAPLADQANATDGVYRRQSPRQCATPRTGVPTGCPAPHSTPYTHSSATQPCISVEKAPTENSPSDADRHHRLRRPTAQQRSGQHGLLCHGRDGWGSWGLCHASQSQPSGRAAAETETRFGRLRPARRGRPSTVSRPSRRSPPRPWPAITQPTGHASTQGQCRLLRAPIPTADPLLVSLPVAACRWHPAHLD